MNKKGFSLPGFIILIIGLIIALYPIMSCVGWGGAPYDINGINECIFSLGFLIQVGIGAIIATIGAFLSGSGNN